MSDLETKELVKIPYAPTENNFFEISKDPISQARLKALNKFFKEVSDLLFPFDFAISLFGSLSKGKILTSESALQTDIDLKIYVDTFKLSVVLNKDKDLAMKLGLKPNSSDLFGHSLRIYLSIFLQETLLKILQDNKDCKVSSKKQVQILLNEDGLEKTVKRFERNLLSVEELAMLFAFDIGLGLRKYIHRILNKISEKKIDSERDELWNKITFAALSFLRKGDLGTNLKILNNIPSTFEEAKRVYGYTSELK